MSAAEPKVADILLRIVGRRRERVAEVLGGQVNVAGLGDSLTLPPSLPCDRRLPPGERGESLLTSNLFLGGLAARRGRAIIAEIKMGSPRLGSLAGRVNPIAQAQAYAAGGAAALSVVVEPDFFQGSYRLLAECKAASGLPAVAKDFVVHEIQLQWASHAGADAVLLIAALHEPAELRAYAQQARALGLVPLIETHTAEDVAKLAGADWELVGVNNRDLRTFEVTLENSIDLAPLLPASALRVAESALHSHADLARLRAAGFDAFLIGESLLLSADPAAKLRELLQ